MPTTVAEVRAAEIFDALDASFILPDVTLSSPEYELPSHTGNPLYSPIHKVALADLTAGTIGGTGSFEVLMASMKTHLQSEFDKSRITGSEYTNAYIALTQLAMTTGLQFTMGQELSYWQAAGAREQAKALEIASVTAAVMLETAKAQLAMQRYQADLAQAQYALTKLQLASEDARYKLTFEQIEAAHSQHSNTKTDGITPVAGTIKLQSDLLVKQLASEDARYQLTLEQVEATHSQHSETKLDNVTAVAGTIKRQKDLLETQKDSFVRASDATIAKMYLDAWLTQLTINEGSTPPDQMSQANINAVMLNTRTRASLG